MSKIYVFSTNHVTLSIIYSPTIQNRARLLYIFFHIPSGNYMGVPTQELSVLCTVDLFRIIRSLLSENVPFTLGI